MHHASHTFHTRAVPRHEDEAFCSLWYKCNVFDHLGSLLEVLACKTLFMDNDENKKKHLLTICNT